MDRKTLIRPERDMSAAGSADGAHYQGSPFLTGYKSGAQTLGVQATGLDFGGTTAGRSNLPL
jgi:hypothetical protein